MKVKRKILYIMIIVILLMEISTFLTMKNYERLYRNQKEITNQERKSNSELRKENEELWKKINKLEESLICKKK